MSKEELKEKIEFLLEEFEEGYINPYKLVVQIRGVINQ